MNDGIIIGCDNKQEWLLPWWWMHYSLHNNYPVTFVNFGNMSKEAQLWCTERGELKHLNFLDFPLTPKDEIHPPLLSIWESSHPQNDLWETRAAWFTKPFALLESPYKRTIWIDTDCQIRGELGKLFEFCENPSGMAMRMEPDVFQELDIHRGLLQPGELLYNSGVIVYKNSSPVIKEWANQSLTQNRYFVGDQQLLSHILFINKITIQELPEIYNWRMDYGGNLDAVIYHWLGSFKEGIKQQIALLTHSFFMNLSI